MDNQDLLLALPLIPLVGAVVNYLLTSKRENWHNLSGWIATLFAAGSFLVAIKLTHSLYKSSTVIETFAWTWFSLDAFKADFALKLDNLSAVMILVITGVGSLIHLYAIGYMAEDANRPRFFSYINLFLFAMLLLVLGDNLLLMFVGWEGVGLCSYLLIGFWFSEMDNAKAGQKAFVVNRIGDAGFIIGVFLLVGATGALSFDALEAAVDTIPAAIISIAAFCLFIGAVGKSAQIPLYVWLPDAMAGPTPVSALIHAATMVTAGVYMMARMSFLYLNAPEVLLIVTVISTLTAFVAATIALVQNDIKKVLAYSTVSQLGFMFMAIGASAFSNGIYHVVTHAFFKACLFMAAGSVIIGCHHEQDMRRYGGLWKKMPFTFVAYLVATLAIAGLPTTSGFYSKDAILWTLFSSPGVASELMLIKGVTLSNFCHKLAMFTAFLTAFYMTRSLMMTFFGSYRGKHEAHESAWVVTLPLTILAILSWGFAFFWGEQLMQFLAPWTRPDMLVGHHQLVETNPTYHSLELISSGVAIAGVLLGVVFYGPLGSIPVVIARKFSSTHRLLLDKWWIDELYEASIVKPLKASANFLFKFIDRFIVDGSVNGSGMLVAVSGEVARIFHPGRIGLYALMMFLATVFLIIFWILL